jgi:tRNA(Ile)-lysidine synthase
MLVRPIHPGDRFQPLGMRGTKKIHDFLADRKVDRPLREEVPLLVAGDNIVWVIGHEIADSVKIGCDTSRLAGLEVQRYYDV